MIKRKKGKRPPITYYGGKQKMTRHILPIIPEHNLYCEPFVGGGAVFWSKDPSHVEVINDLNGHVVNFYRVMQQEFGMLRVLIQATPHSRRAHREADMILKYPDQYSSMSRAWAFWCQTVQGFSGQLGKGWAYERKGHATTHKTWSKKFQFDRALARRLDNVQIECNDALKVIASRDTEDSFFYVDPPYFNSNCGHYTGYSEQDFRDLLELLSRIKGKFLLSSYPSDVLSKFTKQHGWNTRQFQAAVSVTYKTTKTKTEVLTSNYPI